MFAEKAERGMMERFPGQMLHVRRRARDDNGEDCRARVRARRVEIGLRAFAQRVPQRAAHRLQMLVGDDNLVLGVQTCQCRSHPSQVRILAQEVVWRMNDERLGVNVARHD